MPPPADPHHRPAPVLRRGSQGSAVKSLQAGLLREFPALARPIRDSGGADGKFGAGTEAAVRAFQRMSGLTADGVVGALTWAALAEHSITP